MTPGNQTRSSILAASSVGARLIRTNVALAWVGDIVRHIPGVIIALKNPRPLKAGIPGQSDSNGWMSVTVTPEMVGQKVAVYCAVEDKQGAGRITKGGDQHKYLLAVIRAGGRAGVARSDEDVRLIVTGEVVGLGLPPE